MSTVKETIILAITDCDRMLLNESFFNDQERIDHRQDERRLKRYEQRRDTINAHRNRLVVLYTLVTGEMWKEVAF